MSFELRHHIESIVKLTDDEFDLILSHFKRIHFVKNQIVVHENNKVVYDYFIIQGLMKASSIDYEGKEHIIYFAIEGCWITDSQAYHQQLPATYLIDTVEPTKALAISLENLEKLCRDFPKMESFFRKKTTMEQVMLQRRILCLISHSAKERYESLLVQYPTLIQRVPKVLIASYLGVSRETLSRLSHA